MKSDWLENRKLWSIESTVPCALICVSIHKMHIYDSIDGLDGIESIPRQVLFVTCTYVLYIILRREVLDVNLTDWNFG